MTRFDATIAAPRYIPFERRVLALDDFSNGPIFVKRGSAHDLGDPIVRARAADVPRIGWPAG